MTEITIRFADSAANSLEDQVHHLLNFMEESAAWAKIDALVDDIYRILSAAPKGSPVSYQTSELGIFHYHELNTGLYRVFYEIHDQENTLFVLLVLRQKQSVEKALIRYCLLSG